MTSIREDLREFRQEFKDDVGKLHERLNELGKDVQDLKESRARASGAWATLVVVGSLLATIGGVLGGALVWLAKRAWPGLFVLMTSCAAQGPNGAALSWPHYLRPVTVVLDKDMSPACLEASRAGYAAASDWVDYLRVLEVRGPGPARMGEIVVRQGVPGPKDKDVVGRARRESIRGRDLLSVEVVLYGCGLSVGDNVNVVAHELGHALGLEHSPEGLMREGRPFQWGLTADEWWWVQ